MFKRIRNICLIGIILVCANVSHSLAQSDIRAPIIFNVLVIDVNKLVDESKIGRAVKVQHDQAKFALINEFNALQTELISEEQRLSKIRPSMDVSEFRQLAKDFDKKSTQVREAYIERKTRLEYDLSTKRRKLFEASIPYLKKILNENNATVLIRKDQTVLAANAVDITDLAIQAINTNLNIDTFLEVK